MSYKKIPLSSSEVILSRFDPSPEALEVVDPKLPPAQTIQLLRSAGLLIDLTIFFAHALPMRESIWWCAIVLELRLDDWSELERDTLLRCKEWVLKPEEAKRRLVEQRLQILGHDCAIGWLAQAVFWSGVGSIADSAQPDVMPVPYLYAKAVAGAINTAALKPEWKNYHAFYLDTFALAEDLANGGQGVIKRAGAILP